MLGRFNFEEKLDWQKVLKSTTLFHYNRLYQPGTVQTAEIMI